VKNEFPPDDSPLGPSRRTVLAAERTWLAWFRTGIGVAAAAVAVGGVLPKLDASDDTSSTGYIVLGAAYGLLSVAIFVLGWRRQREVASALRNNDDLPSDMRDVALLTSVAGLLALATVALLFLEL
jgi:putative membrane protein